MTDKLIATLDKNGARHISTDLWGIFFEDISYSGDGGLNADLVQNGAFEYNRSDREDWSNYSFWRKIIPAGSFAAFGILDDDPVAVENPHYAEIELDRAPAAMENTGWDGMVFRSGETYDFSAWMRIPQHCEVTAMPITIALLDGAGNALAARDITVASRKWAKIETSLTIPEHEDATRDDAVVSDEGVLRLTFSGEGAIDLDFVTLEPRTTYQGLKHFRPDLVKALADLHPRFMRFPGGCITHGLGMDNMYHWDRTIGPVEHRPHNFNLWGYHQSFRIGYYEYLCLCETIGAKPLPVLPAGVSCQNTSQGPVPIAQKDMPAYIDEVLHLIEFCNGDAKATQWGAKRAAMGHPEPFGLEYLGIGNEDLIDDVFRNRFQQIFDAVKKAYPHITVIGTVGPSPKGKDYEEGWQYAREAGVPIVDEHSYQSSSWWFHNLDHYDHTDRKGPKVYLGEYGSWDTQLINGLSEAAFMGRMELNGDAVVMASYAPLFAKNGHHSWNPNLIYFDNEHVHLPYSYWVQRMYASTTADTAWPVSVEGPTMLRRELPDTVKLRIDGNAKADLNDLTVTTGTGETIALGDVHYQGNRLDLPLDIHADAYSIDTTVVYYSGRWGMQLVTGDIDGKNHNVVSLGRGHEVRVMRDGTGYALAGTEVSMNEVRPGTTWRVRIEIADRGRSMKLYIDGKLIADGKEAETEPRRTVTVSRDSAAGITYLRVVNATADPVEVDARALLDGLNIEAESAARATATVLSGDDPYAGGNGKASPTVPIETTVDMGDGVYDAPSWSFSTIAFHG